MRLAALLVPLLLCACASASPEAAAPSQVTLRVEPGAASPGDTVALVLRNGSAQRIGYNLCTSALERSRGGEWRARVSDRACTRELRTLEPGAEARYPIGLSERLEPGEYRFVARADPLDAAAGSEVPSDPFRVGA